MATLTQTIDAKVKRFMQWWGEELASLIPAKLRRLVTAERMAVVSVVGAQAEEARVELAKSGQRKALAKASFAPTMSAEGQVVPIEGPEAAQRWRQLLSAVPRGTHAALAMPPEWVLRRLTKLPIVVEENLRQVVGYEMDRLTPFKAEQVVYDARVISRDHAEGMLNVEVVAAPKVKFEKFLARFTEQGITLAAIRPSAQDETFNMLAPDLRPKPAGRALSTVNALLALVLFTLLLMAVALPIWQKRQQAMQLDPILSRAQEQAAKAVKLSEELTQKVEEHNFSLNKKATQLASTALINEFSNVLPVPNTWVQQLDVKTTSKGRTVQVQGDSTLGGKVQELIEQSGLVQNTAIKSPIRALQGTDRFQYNIEADLKALPEPVPLTEEQLLIQAKALIEKAELAKNAASTSANGPTISSANPGTTLSSPSASNPVSSTPGGSGRAPPTPAGSTAPGKTAGSATNPQGGIGANGKPAALPQPAQTPTNPGSSRGATSAAPSNLPSISGAPRSPDQPAKAPQ